MSLTFAELAKGALSVLFLVVAFSVVTTTFVNLFVPNTYVFISLGYSMCGERSPYLDFLSLKQTTCSIVPGDALVVVRDYPPKIGDVACVNTTDGIVCHRVVRFDGDRPCMEGDAAKWELCFDESSYVGRVVGKLPRIYAMPVLATKALLTGDLEALSLIDRGSYNPFDNDIKTGRGR